MSTVDSPILPAERSTGRADGHSIPRAGLAFALLAFAATRIYLLLLLVPASSDTRLYFKYAVRGVDHGQQAFRDYPIEYPTLGYWTMAVPRWLDRRLSPEELGDRAVLATTYRRYQFAFRSLMLLCDALSFAMLLTIVSRRRPKCTAAVAWSYVLGTYILGHVLYDRLDVGLTLLLMGWATCRVVSYDGGARSWWNVGSYLLFGLGASYKLVTVVAVPFLLVADGFSERTWGRRLATAVMLGFAFVAGVLLPFAVQFPESGLSQLGFLEMHGSRGLEIESTLATPFLLQSLFSGGVRTAVRSAVEVVAPGADAVAKWSVVALAVVLAVMLVVQLASRRRSDRRLGDLFALQALLVTLALSKVLSIQYFVFAIPIALLLVVELVPRVPAGRMIGTTIVLTTFSTLVFPYFWFDELPGGIRNPVALVSLHPLPCLLLIARNAIFAGLVVWLGMRLLRESRETAPGGGTQEPLSA